VTIVGLRDLMGLKNLTTLDLRGLQLTDADLKELVAFKSLTTLNLVGAHRTSADSGRIPPDTGTLSMNFARCCRSARSRGNNRHRDGRTSPDCGEQLRGQYRIS